MDESQFESFLHNYLDVATHTLKECKEDDETIIDEVQTYETVGMLTKNKGLVIATSDGSEFVITIHKRS